MQERFPMNADSFEEAVGYLKNRAIQGLMDVYRPHGQVERLLDGNHEWGVKGLCRAPDGSVYQTLYIYAHARNSGLLSHHAKNSKLPFITAPDCDIEAFFQKKQIPYVVCSLFTKEKEYQAIQAYFGNRKAERSQLFYMNHIDEGLAILHWIGASDRAKRAFCLHPIFQLDDDLRVNYEKAATFTDDPQVLVLAMEYRNIANAYLSRREIKSIDEIASSPLPEVQDMLRADKIQNYKDFLAHHKDTHHRKEALDAYFINWLKKLEISMEQFQAFCARLRIE